MFQTDGVMTVDVQPIYDSCVAEDGSSHRLSASDVAAASSSPFSLYCRYHADPAKMDLPDHFLQALSDKGHEHESHVVASEYPETKPLTYKTRKGGFMQGLELMAGGADALANVPLYWLPDGMHGSADVLEKLDGGSVFGDHHYVVKEIKMATNIREPHVVQAAFYALMLGSIQRRPPEQFQITDGNQSTTTYKYAEHEGRLLECMEQAGRIIRGDLVPPAVYGCGSAPWSDYCNETAIQNDDVSLIPKVGRSMRDRMAAAGLSTVQSIASLQSASELQHIKGVGDKTSVEYFDAARAISGGKPVRRAGSVIRLPERSTEIFLDLEGLNAMFDTALTDYLIGALVRKNGSEEYHSFVAEEKREDTMLKSFLDFMDEQSDFAIYHWHNYEQFHMRSLMERHGMTSHLGLLGPDTMYDLHRIATGAYAFPTYSHSIKDIAKWLGFEWRHAGVGATSAIETYLGYADDPESNRADMQQVIDYNEDDCIATRVIKDWLVSVR